MRTDKQRRPKTAGNNEFLARAGRQTPTRSFLLSRRIDNKSTEGDMEHEEYTLVGVRFDAKLERVTRVRAAELGISKSELIRRAVVDWLADNGRELERVVRLDHDDRR